MSRYLLNNIIVCGRKRALCVEEKLKEKYCQWVISNNLWRPMLFKQGEIPVWQKELFPLCRFIKAANSFVLSVNTVSEGL